MGSSGRGMDRSSGGCVGPSRDEPPPEGIIQNRGDSQQMSSIAGSAKGPGRGSPPHRDGLLGGREGDQSLADPIPTGLGDPLGSLAALENALGATQERG